MANLVLTFGKVETCQSCFIMKSSGLSVPLKKKLKLTDFDKTDVKLHCMQCDTISYLVVFCVITGMKNAMKTTPPISSISCIHQRGRGCLTAGSMCWGIFSRYTATIQFTTLVKTRCLATYLFSPRVFFLQGGAPSPFDRNFGTKLGVRAIQWISERLTENFRLGRVTV